MITYCKAQSFWSKTVQLGAPFPDWQSTWVRKHLHLNHQLQIPDMRYQEMGTNSSPKTDQCNKKKLLESHLVGNIFIKMRIILVNIYKSTQLQCISMQVQNV